ncbi:helix-turn-helix domain-containing protein [Haloarchaeobius sp. HME9146]|uniref:helix-turn-helix domain-containing protein n=1 Tax=Haloarchaeobius sp. HME9146 TaxID=2978732 RepID=UPI0021BE9217|nr:helix-turn-helix domain-containing protein [Haloarchaeobius sp. HME9146]MCT9097863.1 helix-turn-helix domain-containing protein [Haloarchaeobius sp. HME9146]
MTVIADISIPATQFALGRLFDAFPDIEVELERLVPIETGIMPLFWMSGADEARLQRALADDALTKSVRSLTETDDRCLFEIVWSSDVNGVIQPLMKNEGDVLRAVGNADEWTFRLLFAERKNLTKFREDCLAHGVQIELRRIFNPAPSTGDPLLTKEQREMIALAFEEGYWDVPRDTTLGELGDQMGISDSAASQRLRRGVKSLIQDTGLDL